jgi:hypothetical protein
MWEADAYDVRVPDRRPTLLFVFSGWVACVEVPAEIQSADVLKVIGGAMHVG